jgi:hypothetical protein
MGEKIGDPLAVADIGLSSGDRLHVGCIHDEKGERALKNGVDGLPEDAGAFHGYVGDRMGAQPVRQDHQFSRCRSEGLYLPLY